MDRKLIVLVYAGLLLYMSLPLISAFIAEIVASAAGAQLDEGNAHSCIILGTDVGGLLYGMFVAGWLIMFTVPTGLIATIGFSIFLAVRASS